MEVEDIAAATLQQAQLVHSQPQHRSGMVPQEAWLERSHLPNMF